MKPSKIITIIISALLLSASCGSEEPAPVKDRLQRAVLVYMVADNSLGTMHCDDADLEEMVMAAKAGDLGESRLLVYHAGRSEAPALKEVTATGIKTLKQYDYTESSVSSARMSRVINDFRNETSAEKYGLVLWSHGSGWIQNGMEAPTVSTQAWGDDRGRYMNVTTLAETLEGKGFDYVYFDCCYMAGIEVVYQMRNVTPVIVASATELPIDGMPYNSTLKYLMASSPDLTAAAKATFNHYDALDGEDRTCSISVINTESLDQLADATAAIYGTTTGTSDGFSPQPFMLGSCYLYDFKQYVEALTNDETAIQRFDNALQKTVVYSANTPKLWDIISLNHHCGLSTYLLDEPGDEEYRNYYQLDWFINVASLLINR